MASADGAEGGAAGAGVAGADIAGAAATGAGGVTIGAGVGAAGVTTGSGAGGEGGIGSGARAGGVSAAAVLVSGAGSAGTGALGCDAGAGLGVTGRGLAAACLGAAGLAEGGFNFTPPLAGAVMPGGGRNTMRPAEAIGSAWSMAVKSTETADDCAAAGMALRQAKASIAAEHNSAHRKRADGHVLETVSNLSLAIGLKVFSLTPTPIWPLDAWAGLAPTSRYIMAFARHNRTAPKLKYP